jgi:protein gp37
MASKSAIEWTESTWNPIVGCTILSPGCTHCYAMRTAARLSNNSATPHYAGTVKTVNGHPVWTGKVALAPERVLTEPVRRKKPTMYFVNSMSDLFHEDVPDDWIDKVFAVMALTPQHTYQALTKRPARMRSYMAEMTRQEWWKARIFGKTARAIRRNGQTVQMPVLAITVPEWLAREKGLI